MRVLITGAAGQLGRVLIKTVPPGVEALGVTRAELDISDAHAVRATIERWRPNLIINAAAYTAVDKAEMEREAADAINAKGPRYLAEAAGTIGGCRLIHISTDYVFDGQSARPYRPDDMPNPISSYGRTKLDGERAVLEILGDRALVLRTSWVYAAQGKNFLNTMLRLMRERGTVRVVADQIGTPTAVPPLCAVLWAFAARADVAGVFHWTDEGVASWYDFAATIAEEARGLRLLDAAISVTPIRTAEYPMPAKRPAFSLLDSGVTIATLGIARRPWQQELLAVLSEIAEVVT